MAGVTTPAGDAAHWDAAYRLGDTTRSWYQQHADTSLRLVDDLGIDPRAAVIDVGGGASTLADSLLDRGYCDVTVLDVSAEALQTARHRLGPRAGRIHWLAQDLRGWRPDRTWALWHDRAVLHFFVHQTERERYVQALDTATGPGSYAVVAAFAPHGPTHCSGLPVRRYDTADLAGLLGARWQLVTSFRHEHTTPAGGVQPFTWAAFHRAG